jgi:hypothetical protein
MAALSLRLLGSHEVEAAGASVRGELLQGFYLLDSPERQQR